MSRPIEATPTLGPEDAARLIKSLGGRCSKEEALRRRSRAKAALAANAARIKALRPPPEKTKVVDMATQIPEWSPGKVALCTHLGTSNVVIRRADNRFEWVYLRGVTCAGRTGKTWHEGWDRWLKGCVWVGSPAEFETLRALAKTPEELVDLAKRLTAKAEEPDDGAILAFLGGCGIDACTLEDAATQMREMRESKEAGWAIAKSRVEKINEMASAIIDVTGIPSATGAKNLEADLRTAITEKARELLTEAAKESKTQEFEPGGFYRDARGYLYYYTGCTSGTSWYGVTTHEWLFNPGATTKVCQGIPWKCDSQSIINMVWALDLD